MIKPCKRGPIYRVVGSVGEKRVRLSLGTRRAEHAHLLVSRIDRALSEGSQSSLWQQLRAVLPAQTFLILASFVGWAEPHRRHEPVWAELSTAFECWMGQRMALNRLRSSTAERYRHLLREFTKFLYEQN